MLREPDIQSGPAVMALALLLPFLSEDIPRISKSEIIKRLVQMLQGRDARDAAMVMGSIARIDELREAILQSEGVISTLRHMLRGTNSDAAAYAIGGLSKDDNVLEDLRKHDVAEDLIVLMNNEDSALASGWALASLARNPDVNYIVEVIPGLVSKLRVENSADREDDGEHSFTREGQVVIGEKRQAALLALIGLAQNTTLRGHIISNNSVKPLVDMLNGPHAEDAATALKLLSENGMSYKE